MIPKPAVLILAAATSGAALAEVTSQPAAPPPSGQPCATEQARFAAEEATPGILRRMMEEALRACLAAAGQPAAPGNATSAGVGR